VYLTLKISNNVFVKFVSSNLMHIFGKLFSDVSKSSRFLPVLVLSLAPLIYCAFNFLDAEVAVLWLSTQSIREFSKIGFSSFHVFAHVFAHV
jgi:hypothetical protein